MKRLYLASSINLSAKHIARDIGADDVKLKLAFITTAAEGKEGDKTWLQNDRQGLVDAGFDLFDYTITNKTQTDIEHDLHDVDIIHVNGGSTLYLLIQAKQSGFDKWIVKAVGQGKIYTGSSAGSIAAATHVSRIYQENPLGPQGLGLTNTLVLPHWGNDHFQDKYLNHRLKLVYQPENKIVLLNDYQYLKVRDDSYQIIDIRD